MYQPNQYQGQNYSPGVSAASVALSSANTQSYVPSFAGGQQNGAGQYGAPQQTAANIAMSNLPKPTTNNPYTNNSTQSSNQYSGGMNQPGNQNYGNQPGANQNYGNQNQHGNQNYGNQPGNQNYGNQSGMNQNSHQTGMNQNYGNQPGNQNYGNQPGMNQGANQNYGNQNQHGNQNYGNQSGMNQGANQNYGARPAQTYGNQGGMNTGNQTGANQNYSATQNYGANKPTQNYNQGGMNQGGMYQGGMNQGATNHANPGQNYGNQGGMNTGNQAMNAQANYGTSAFQNQFALMQLQQQELVQQQRWFSQVDKDHSGTIDAAELAQLTFGGQPLRFEAAKKLLQIFDKDRNNSIDFAEYITLHKFIQAMQKAFNQTDNDRNGVLDAREIHSALQAAGFQLNAQAGNALYHRYNKLNTGIKFASFLEIAADVALLRVAFDHSDHDRDGVVSLRFDELLSIVSTI